jgi:hypothetical protein
MPVESVIPVYERGQASPLQNSEGPPYFSSRFPSATAPSSALAGGFSAKYK